MRSRRHVLTLVGLVAAAALCLSLCPFLGIERIPFAVLHGGRDLPGNAHWIFWQVRVPRVLTAFVVGTGLAVCGMAFQAMFRNPLATPFTLGVAGGASLGAAMYVRLGLSFAFLTVSGVSLFAFLGALGSIFLVYGLTRLRHGFSTATLLLAGIAVNLFSSSLIMLVQYLSDFTHSFEILHWLMGGVETMGYERLLGLVPLVATGVMLLYALTHELNLMSVGEELAISRGVNVKRVKHILFLATSICVGGVVAACGPISFVGMMVPHICRLLVGSNHRYLLPATCLFGGVFLVICDTVARMLVSELPVGVVTSVLGGPFFVWLLVCTPGRLARLGKDG